MDAVGGFWRWFSEHGAALASRFIEPWIAEELEKQLSNLGKLTWEIGRHPCGQRWFALSPNGDPSLWDLARTAIARAPALAGWQFYAGKPARKWDLVFDLHQHRVDGKNWEVVLCKFADGTFDLLFKPDQGDGLSKNTLREAAETIADGELGEELRLKLIGDIEVVASWAPEIAPAARKLEVGLLRKVLLRNSRVPSLSPN